MHQKKKDYKDKINTMLKIPNIYANLQSKVQEATNGQNEEMAIRRGDAHCVGYEMYISPALHFLYVTEV